MQSFKHKISSANKKALTLAKDGIEPLEEGYYNFNNPSHEVEVLAFKRSLTCLSCELCVDEPIDFLKVSDIRNICLSNKICDECGCTLSYKTRQSIKICNKWQE